MTIRAPSVKTLMTYLRVSKPRAKYLRKAMKFELDFCQLHKLTRQWVRQCHSKPSEVEQVIDTINHVLGYHGVEAIHDNRERPFWWDVRAIYCNTGDSYAATILYDVDKQTWNVTSWGDFVERHGL